MKIIKRTDNDRRSGYDRRRGYDLAVITELGKERRKKERRTLPELRNNWIRVSEWSSAINQK